MSSLIEQAARRLEQLRQAGVELPGDNLSVNSPGAAAAVPHQLDAAKVQAPAEEPKQTSKRVDLDLAALYAQGFLTPDAPRIRFDLR